LRFSYSVYCFCALLLLLSSVQVVAATEYQFAVWGSQGSGVGQFNLPQGIAVSNTGYVYVSDYNNHRIQKFTSTGTPVKTWGTFGSGTGQFIRPKGIAVDGAGNVYVVDSGNNRIQKFDANGGYITQWGGGVSERFVAIVTSPAMMAARRAHREPPGPHVGWDAPNGLAVK
jgi:DNA-binding beta-propeller fold protein YncE